MHADSPPHSDLTATRGADAGVGAADVAGLRPRTEAAAYDVLAAPVPWLARLAYSLGNACETILSRSFELFVLFFYTTVKGVPGTITGLAILVAMVVDAITDPLVGSWSDSLRTRFGRRHLLMYASALPSALFFVLLFAPPEGLGELALGAWLAFTAIGLRVSVTLFHIPWSAQVAELSTDTHERLTLAVWRNLFAVAAMFGIAQVAFETFFHATPDYPRGNENPDAYLPFGLAVAATMALVMLVSAAGTRPRMRQVEAAQPAAPQRFSPGVLLPAWRDLLFRFRNFRAFVFAAMFLLTAFSMFNTMTLYFGNYYWGLDASQIKRWQFAFIFGGLLTMLAGVALSMPAGRRVVQRLRLATLFRLSIAVGVAMWAGPMLLRECGLLPGDGADVLPLLQWSNAIAGFSLGMVQILSALVSAEASEEHEGRTGIKATAMLFGFVFLAMKFASGLGKMLAGITLDVIDFPAASTAAGASAAQLSLLGWACTIVLLALGTLSLGTFAGYRSPAPDPCPPTLPGERR
jgi:Na+/melibiose symporter-like transporter